MFNDDRIKEYSAYGITIKAGSINMFYSDNFFKKLPNISLQLGFDIVGDNKHDIIYVSDNFNNITGDIKCIGLTHVDDYEAFIENICESKKDDDTNSYDLKPTVIIFDYTSNIFSFDIDIELYRALSKTSALCKQSNVISIVLINKYVNHTINDMPILLITDLCDIVLQFIEYEIGSIYETRVLVAAKKYRGHKLFKQEVIYDNINQIIKLNEE